MAKIASKSSTMVGENFEIYSSQMTKIASKASTMVGENYEINSSQMAKIVSKFSTMVGENYEMNSSQMTKIASKSSTMVGENFEINSFPLAKWPRQDWVSKLDLRLSLWQIELGPFNGTNNLVLVWTTWQYWTIQWIRVSIIFLPNNALSSNIYYLYRLSSLERMAESVKFFGVHASGMRRDWRASPNFGVHAAVLRHVWRASR